MSDWFSALDPVTQALFGGLFTWAITAGGAALVFLAAEVNRRLLDAMLGFAAGVMIAASFWSLLAPTIEIAGHGPNPAWLPVSVGFLFGSAVIHIARPGKAHTWDRAGFSPIPSRGDC